MVGAKCETEIISIFRNFIVLIWQGWLHFVMFHVLIWTSVWNDFQILEV